MTTFINSKQAPADSSTDINPLANPSDLPAHGISVSARYFFNLTNGAVMIRDEEGIETSSIQAAVVSAMEAVEELRAQDPLNSEEWRGWWLEVVDASGQAVQTIPLDTLSAH